MAGLILVVNAGSTSLKISAVDDDDVSRELDSLADAPQGIRAVAHRIVHGGGLFSEPVLIDDAVEEELRSLVELAPLHNRPAVAAVEEARRLQPDVPHIAVFDSAFHATMPAEAATYALPLRWREDWGIRRFGFHGLSVEWAAGRVPVSRLVVCHLGGGCSATAVRDGKSVDTTMGYSPLEGLPMATRAGTIDVEIALHLLRTGRLGIDELERALEEESGLLGLSGVSARVEELEGSAEPAAALALRVFAHRVTAAVAALAASLGGLDALVFTGGVGEHSASIRADVCERLAFLGVDLDRERNQLSRPDEEISSPESPVAVWVIRSQEDLVAARAARRLLAARSASV